MSIKYAAMDTISLSVMLLATNQTASSCQNVETTVKELLKEESSDVYEEDKKHLTP
jgi:hypothetical protein